MPGNALLGSEPKLNIDWEILAINNGFNPERWKEITEMYPK